ncbi:MAG: hypothetical protein HYR49_10670 [Gammaproteobacteria bacterium]|nr:hypothetical protein [Gammaproteobacteria bacterium]
MLNKDYKEMLQLLSDEGAEYFVVGAYALAAHGYPRATGDLDICVRASAHNASKVYSALRKFGAPLEHLKEHDLTSEDLVFQIGVAPTRIDILTGISGVAFDEADADKLFLDIDGLQVPFISVAKLIQNKVATGRPKDIDDAARLRKLLKS